MRGPGLKSTLDVRRLWRCPSCGYERHVGQMATSVLCFCKDPPIQMKLIEGKRVVRPEPRPVARFIDESELPPDDTPAGQAPPIAAVAVVEVVAVEAVIETVIETVTETAVVTAAVTPESSGPPSKKRRRRSRGNREQIANEPRQTTSPDAEIPASDPVTPPADADFGEGISP